MIKVSVLYPNGEHVRFDMDYYMNKHMPLVQDRLGAACKKVEVEEGLSGAAPDSPPPYRAVCRFLLDSVDAFQAAFGPHADEIMGDIPNYTDIEPIVQIGDVRM
jgi:uncharacterized protein (TIGR02118 family)